MSSYSEYHRVQQLSHQTVEVPVEVLKVRRVGYILLSHQTVEVPVEVLKVRRVGYILLSYPT